MSKTIQATLILFLGYSAPSLLSQDLHIHYDAFTENLRYVYEGQEINTPKAKKGYEIYLHIENYNNYLYDLEVSVDDEIIEIFNSNQSVGSSLMNTPFSQMSISSFFGGLNSGAGDGFDELDGVDFEGPGFAESNQQWAQVNMLKQKFDRLTREMVQTENQLRSVQKGIQEYKDAQEVKHMVLEEVQKIKYNPALSPEQIKKLTTEYLKKGLEAKSVEEIDLDKILSLSDQKRHLIDKLEALEKGHRIYKKQVGNLTGISALLGGFGFADSEFVQFKETANEILENSKEIEQNLDSNKVELKMLINNAQKSDLTTLTQMRYEFEAMEANNFSHTYRTEARGDITTLELEFTLKDSLGYTGAKRKIRATPIKVPVYGGLKINTSVGVSFAQFFNKPQSYFLRDSKIQGQDQDSFFPTLTSFFHFYSQSSSNTSVGGALGVGIPLNGGGEGFQSVSFFLGPSLIFGQGQRIVLTGGIMGGKVEQLDQGYEVGDSFSSDADILPVHYPYELGMFIGLSFNLAGK